MPTNGNLPRDLYEPTPGDRTHAVREQALGMLPPHSDMLAVPAESIALAGVDSQHVKYVIEKLYAAAKGQQPKGRSRQRRMLVGLAAPQIGEPVRIVLIDAKILANRMGESKLECYINPEIVWRSRETTEGREGCFSTGQVWGLVRRSIAVKVRAITPEGRVVERIFEDFAARIAQHEIDHLEGIRFPERITSDRKRHWVHAEEIDNYPHQIKRWHRLCTAKQWQQAKTTPTQ